MILADQIRKMGQYNFTPIVFFITSMPTREIEAYRQIGWCYYLLKPFTDQELEAILEKVLVDYFDAQKKDMSQITLDYKGHTQKKVYLEDIAYVEYKLRRILIKFINDEEPHRYKYMPLKQFAKDLSDDFIQIHQSLLVNKKNTLRTSTVTVIRWLFMVLTEHYLLAVALEHSKGCGLMTSIETAILSLIEYGMMMLLASFLISMRKEKK